jgi:hypothetical protein
MVPGTVSVDGSPAAVDAPVPKLGELPELLQADKSIVAAMTTPTDARTASALTGGPFIGDRRSVVGQVVSRAML